MNTGLGAWRPQSITRVWKSDSGSSQEQNTANCLDSCNNLLEMGLDV